MRGDHVGNVGIPVGHQVAPAAQVIVEVGRVLGQTPAIGIERCLAIE